MDACMSGGGAGRELNYERRDPLTKGYVEPLGQPSPVAYRCILFLSGKTIPRK